VQNVERVFAIKRLAVARAAAALPNHIKQSIDDLEDCLQADTSALEQRIDNLVCRLYNRTYDEVKVIEPEFTMGRAEYEGRG
jgi:hypothetical protein